MVRSAPPRSAGPLRTPTRSSLQGRKRTEGPLMTFDVLALLLAAGGGFFAAAIGALHAFIFTGFMGIAGLAIAMAGAGTNFLTFVAFGPVFGPHIAFAGGVAAAAYAARTGKDVGGKDIGVPLISIERPDVLLVG